MAEKDLETTWLTDSQFGAVTRAMYHNFKDIPTGEGITEIPPGIYALGALAGFHDFGLENTEVEIEYIFEKLKRWYPTPEIYLDRFTGYDDRVTHEPITKEMVEEYVRIMTGKPDFFAAYQREIDQREKAKLKEKARKNSRLSSLPVPPAPPISSASEEPEILSQEPAGIKTYLPKNRSSSNDAVPKLQNKKTDFSEKTGQKLAKHREDIMNLLDRIDQDDDFPSESPESADS